MNFEKEKTGLERLMEIISKVERPSDALWNTYCRLYYIEARTQLTAQHLAKRGVK